jgi:sulfonate transport system substrate-binding protein
VRILRQVARLLFAVTAIGWLPLPAHAIGPEPAPLAQPVELTVGYVKVGHLAPIILVADELKKLGVNLKLVEFVRYADARTALLAGSLDAASVGPADLAISLAQGSTNVVGLMGVGSSPKYVIGRNGVKFESWNDLKGKKIAIAPGSAVWFQFAATLVENGVPYNSFEAVNIQGGGANFDQALKKGDVDGLVTWEPFESIPVMDGYGFFAKGLEYGSSKAVGAELGMFMTTKQTVDGKRAALERFVWVYLEKEEELGKSPTAFAGAYAQLTGMAPEVAAQAAKIIKLGEVISPDQIKRQAKGFADLGVIQKDVSEEIDAHWDGSFVNKALGK